MILLNKTFCFDILSKVEREVLGRIIVYSLVRVLVNRVIQVWVCV